MKKTINILFAAIALAGCSIEESTDTFESRESLYQTEVQCKVAVNSCYIPLNGIFSYKLFEMTEDCTDIFYCNLAQEDNMLEISPAQPGHGQVVWTNAYRGVMFCNEVIECLNRYSPLDDAVKGRFAAEARVLRALYYYYLTNIFNGVPFYTQMVETMEDLEAIRALPRTDANEIRQFLYDDLKTNALPYFTKENGLKARVCEVPGHRAGYALALMLMAKFAMWYEDWDAALEPLLELEKLYGDLTEANYPLSDLPWGVKNTPEGIFEIQHEYSETGIRYYSSLAHAVKPNPQGEGVFDGIFYPELGMSVTGNTSAVATTHLGIFRPATGTSATESTSTAHTSSLFRPLPLTFDEYDDNLDRYTVKIDTAAVRSLTIRGAKIDRRALLVFGMGNIETGETFNQVKKYGHPWAGPKMWCYNMKSLYDSNNHRIFRYADAVLMIAECYCMKGDLETASLYCNKTRIRAGVDPLGYASQNDLLENIRDERARELAGELHRKFDLVRWGIWYEITYRFNENSTMKRNMRPYHRYYPIPDTQCALTHYVLTNDEYDNAN